MNTGNLPLALNDLEFALLLPVVLLYALIASATALVTAKLIRGKTPRRSYWRLLALRGSFWVAGGVFVLTFSVILIALVRGFNRGPDAIALLAFWPATSAIVAALACRSIRRARLPR